MDQWITVIVILAVTAALLTGLTIWSRRETVARAAAVGLFVLALPCIALPALTIMSHPAPQWLWSKSIQTTEHTRVIGFKLQPGVAIYLLLDDPGFEYPRYVMIPWDRKKAEQLREMQANPSKRGNMGITPDGKLKDYPPPQPPRGLKDSQPPPMHYKPKEE